MTISSSRKSTVTDFRGTVTVEGGWVVCEGGVHGTASRSGTFLTLSSGASLPAAARGSDGNGGFPTFRRPRADTAARGPAARAAGAAGQPAAAVDAAAGPAAGSAVAARAAKPSTTKQPTLSTSDGRARSHAHRDGERARQLDLRHAPHHRRRRGRRRLRAGAVETPSSHPFHTHAHSRHIQPVPPRA